MDFAAIIEYIIAFIGQESTMETINAALRLLGEFIGGIFQ